MIFITTTFIIIVVLTALQSMVTSPLYARVVLDGHREAERKRPDC